MMEKPPRNSRYALVYAAILAVVIGATLVAAFVLYSGSHGNRFWLCLGMLLWAEVLTFGYPTRLVLGGATVRRFLPLHFGQGVVFLTYDVGILVLVALAYNGLVFVPLAMAFLVWTTLLAVVGISFIAGGRYARDLEEADGQARQFFLRFQNEFSQLTDDIFRLDGPAADSLRTAFAQARDDFKYLSRDSTPDASAVEGNITSGLGQMRDGLRSFSESTRVAADGPPSTDRTKAILSSLQEVRQLVEKRERLLKQSRQSPGEERS